MKKTFISLFIVLLCNFIQAQSLTFNWAKQMGGDSANNFSRSVAFDASGNVYTAGYFSDTVDFDPGSNVYNLISAGDIDIFISKLDSSGNFVWAKRMGGVTTDGCLGMVLDGSGNVYTTGAFSSVVDFDPGSGKYDLASSGNLDMFICKLDASGNFVWAKQINGQYGEIAFAITLDGSGNIYTTGYFEDLVDFDPGLTKFDLTAGGYYDVFVLKLNSSGNFVWAKQFEGFNNTGTGYSIAVDASKNVYTTGEFYDGVDFNPGSANYILNTGGDLDIFISKLDSSGNFVWAKQIGNTGDDGSTSMALDASANIYTTGYFEGTVDFNPGGGTANLTSLGYTDIFVSKLDNTGNYVWAKKLGGITYEYSNSITLDPSGNVYTTGSFEDSADFDPGASKYNLYANGDVDIFISKLNSSGNFVSATGFGNSSSFGEGTDIAVDNSGKIYTTGYFSGTIDFDPGANTYNLTSSIGYDYFVSKLQDCRTTSSTITVSACNNYLLNGQTYTSSGTYTQLVKNAGGCDSNITLKLTLKNNTSSLTASACASYTLNSQTYTATGVYKQTLTNKAGCDSVLTLNLTIKKNAATINVNACKTYTINSQTYTTTGIYTQTLTNKAGCDSVLTINLTISAQSTTGSITNTSCNFYSVNSQTYTNSGVYTQTLVNKAGCDSILTLNLTITKSTTFGITTTACRNYKLNGQTYTISGVYTQTRVNKANCDSVITLNLTINNADKTVTQTGATLKANATSAAYQWLDCNTGKSAISGQISQSFTATKNGSYAVQVTQNSCKDTSSCYTVTGLGFANTQIWQGISVFPNPTSGQVEIVLNTPLKNGKLKVLNVTGQTIIEKTNLNGNSFSVNLDEQAKGVYFIEISQSGMIYRTKVIRD